ncbi:TetR/AcrR family transcriptional regulator [Aggregicoccus sp. 17bor-14]|uniref:TetR/AcrR family transcriptional regulator n=1 Tax=Myxococcaceae TaxID=31 RepID=UPI00129C8808|nr:MULTISPECIES: TetR/AcrR family transcriptional regulator [Myxococcaceae]MBF5043067.1 TetR/AcrR family transcriptional regulator [Simulacricoccus sp. 17bor-14]MRI88830.1 TetR/AcrR family transcriptional regulator [Aggregicoccus sp. 17bor-14]
MARPADPHAREALMRAARAEFVRQGIRGARIEDITAACGLSKGAFYLHFESKEALFGEVVQGLTARLEQESAAREADMQAFLQEEGLLGDRDYLERSERYERYVALEAGHDMHALESMWDYRDVLDVLIRGSQGTPFATLIWELVDREVARVAQSFSTMQGACQGRGDIDPQLFGSFVIGTYLLVGKQMAQMREKPDLAALARSLQQLIHEGSAPRPAVAPQAPAPRAPRAPAAAHPPSQRAGSTRAPTRRSHKRS